MMPQARKYKNSYFLRYTPRPTFVDNFRIVLLYQLFIKSNEQLVH